MPTESVRHAAGNSFTWQRNLCALPGFYGTVALVAGRMTEHRGRFVALLVGVLLAGLAFSAVPVAAASRKPSAHTIHKAGRLGALAGRGMWIWYVSRSSGGSVSSIIATARKYGVSTVMIKSSDGRDDVVAVQPRPSSQELHASRPARVRVAIRLRELPASQETNVGAEAAVNDGADCLIIDAESEYEGKYVAAQSYITQLRSDIGQSFPVALAGFPYVDYHPGFPYSVFLGPGGRSVQHAADVLGRHRH